MPISLDDLRGDWCRTKSELLADKGLNARWHSCMGPHRSRDSAYRNVIQRRVQSRSRPTQLVYPYCQLEAECRRLRMDTMSTPNHEGVTVLERQLGNCVMKRSQRVPDEHARLAHLYGQSGIQDVGRGETEM